PAGSFKALHALDRFEVVHLLHQRRQIVPIDTTPQAAPGAADGRVVVFRRSRLAFVRDDKPQTLLDQRRQCSPFRGSFSLGTVQQLLGQSDRGSLAHSPSDVDGTRYVNMSTALGQSER